MALLQIGGILQLASPKRVDGSTDVTRNPTGLASALRIWQRLPPRSAASDGLNCIRRSNQRIIQLKPMGANVEWEARRDYADFMEAALASGFFSQLSS